MKHIISVLVENHPGVLARISGLFSARGFNIESLAVGETEDPTVSRMTIVVTGDDRILEQVTKQLQKVVDVIKVWDLAKDKFIQRDLALVRVSATKTNRSKVTVILDKFGAKVVHAGGDSLTVEVTAEEEKIESLLKTLEPFGIKELVRTGRVAIAKE